MDMRMKQFLQLNMWIRWFVQEWAGRIGNYSDAGCVMLPADRSARFDRAWLDDLADGLRADSAALARGSRRD
jgi:hypothetical protein